MVFKGISYSRTHSSFRRYSLQWCCSTYYTEINVVLLVELSWALIRCGNERSVVQVYISNFCIIKSVTFVFFPSVTSWWAISVHPRAASSGGILASLSQPRWGEWAYSADGVACVTRVVVTNPVALPVVTPEIKMSLVLYIFLIHVHTVITESEHEVTVRRDYGETLLFTIMCLIIRRGPLPEIYLSHASKRGTFAITASVKKGVYTAKPGMSKTTPRTIYGRIMLTSLVLSLQHNQITHYLIIMHAEAKQFRLF